MVKNIVIVGLGLAIFSMNVAKDEAMMTRERMLQESINTLEDMYEWMEEDMINGYVDQELGETYLANIEGTAIDLSNMTCCY